MICKHLLLAVRSASADGSLSEQHQLEQLLEHGIASGTLSTSLSNTTNTNTNMGPNGTAQNQNQQGGEQLSKTNLYIRGLQQGTTDKDLVNMCAQ